jgi:pimeloyl-ACP methyl ester carboxylesterase
LSCSIAAWCVDTSTSFVELQFGQSAQPSPEFVSRTIAPLTMIATSNTTFTSASRRNVVGDSRGARIGISVRRQPVPPRCGRTCSERRPWSSLGPVSYDEFGLFQENAQEFGLPWNGPPRVRRTEVAVGGGQSISALVWGDADPEIAFVHGGAQNAHTWDTVALALGRPLVALDLPGHGHSSHRDDHAYWPAENAIAIEQAVRTLAPDARMVVGMSLGGLTSIALTDRAPDLVRSLVLVDVTPGVNREKSTAIAQFIDGPEYFATFDEILQRTIQFNPTRSESSLRRGVLHNAIELPDGRWRWRYDLPRRGSGEGADGSIMPGLSELWDAVGRVKVPLTLVRGSLSPVVDDDDVAELRRRDPDAQVIVVEGAGHSIQGDKPVELANILDELLAH